MTDIRSVEMIDSELALMVAVRDACLEFGGPAPSISGIDHLLDERLGVDTGVVHDF